MRNPSAADSAQSEEECDDMGNDEMLMWLDAREKERWRVDRQRIIAEITEAIRNVGPHDIARTLCRAMGELVGSGASPYDIAKTLYCAADELVRGFRRHCATYAAYDPDYDSDPEGNAVASHFAKIVGKDLIQEMKDDVKIRNAMTPPIANR
jgi:hypothetical protein